MKKKERAIYYGLGWIAGVMTVFTLIALSGCTEEQKSDAQLMKLQQPVSDFAASWIEEYGEKPESIKNYNIVLVRERLNTEILKIEELTKRLDELEVRTEATQTMTETYGIRICQLEEKIELKENKVIRFSAAEKYFDAEKDGITIVPFQPEKGKVFYDDTKEK